MSKEVLQEKAPAVEEFDFIQLIIHDIHACPKGRMLARRRMAGIIKHGLGIYGGLCFFGIRGEVSFHKDFAETAGYGNKNLKPILSTLRPCPDLGQGKFKVGQVLCHLEHLDGTLDTSTPRTAAQIQVERLGEELGMTIKSSFEIEFNIRESASKKYYGHIDQYSTTSIMEECQDLLFDTIHQLQGRGVPVDSIQTEFGPGQFEVTLDIAEGITAPDNTVNFKNIVKTLLKTKGYEATFMTRIDPALGASNGLHYNLSLWTSFGENAFLDVTKPYKLSEFGCHWLAGLIEHAPAMTAFCNPTINCYRRIGQLLAPTYANWAPDDRLCCFRLKLESGNNIYIENRLSTGASNPYLVQTAIIAAGIDGVKRKLPLPEQFDNKRPLPTDLETALQVLEVDTVLTEAIGSKLVEYFTHSKRTYELKEFDGFGELSKEQQLAKEREFYFFNA